jgi:hypothetical protein
MQQELNLPITKWIKFAETPAIETLIRQLHFLSSTLPTILAHQKPLKISLDPHNIVVSAK